MEASTMLSARFFARDKIHKDETYVLGFLDTYTAVCVERDGSLALRAIEHLEVIALSSDFPARMLEWMRGESMDLLGDLTEVVKQPGWQVVLPEDIEDASAAAEIVAEAIQRAHTALRSGHRE